LLCPLLAPVKRAKDKSIFWKSHREKAAFIILVFMMVSENFSKLAK
jgi:hypothetical protein